MRQRAAFDLLNPRGQFPLVLTCEHASYAVPAEYQGLGLRSEEIRRHIGWDIGARAGEESLSQGLVAPAFCAGYSRLLVAWNRDHRDLYLIVDESNGIRVSGNDGLSEA